jgi:hypothetical protein
MKTYFHVRKNDITLDWLEARHAALDMGQKETAHVLRVEHGVATLIYVPPLIRRVEVAN